MCVCVFFLQGYETGRLIAVTPFVAKILEGAPSGNSRVFKPPNPWIMGLFSALHEVRVCLVVRLLFTALPLPLLASHPTERRDGSRDREEVGSNTILHALSNQTFCHIPYACLCVGVWMCVERAATLTPPPSRYFCLFAYCMISLFTLTPQTPQTPIPIPHRCTSCRT